MQCLKSFNPYSANKLTHNRYQRFYTKLPHFTSFTDSPIIARSKRVVSTKNSLMPRYGMFPFCHQMRIRQGQSPIALSAKKSQRLLDPVPFRAHFKRIDVTVHVRTTWATEPAILTIDFPKDACTFSLAERHYTVQEFHIHRPSEHTLNKHHFPLEGHLVGIDDQGEYMVIAVFIDSGTERHGFLDTVVEEYTKGNSMITGFDPYALFPTAPQCFFYHGSLTRSRCSKDDYIMTGVDWVVFSQPIIMLQQSIDFISQLMPSNNRSLQGTDGRDVFLGDLAGEHD